MSSIYDLKSTLTQTALDAFCQKYHIPDSVHPQLHGPNQNIRNSPDGKIGVYTSLFWVDASVFPSSIPWHTKKTRARDPSPTAMEFSAEACHVIALTSEDDQAGPVVQVDHGNQNDNIENIGHDDLNEESGDDDQGDRSEGNDHVGQDETVTILVDVEVQAAAADKPKGKRKKRRATGGASGSNHPPKKLSEDHGTSAATVPFITSSVTPAAEHKEGDDNDSISGPNLRTQHLFKRFIISSDSSHHSSKNATDAEVTSFVRSSVPPSSVMTAAVTTTVTSRGSSTPVLGAGAELAT
ncbi:hypothetical protein Tco_0164862 [Tanacetum coccineum]